VLGQPPHAANLLTEHVALVISESKRSKCSLTEPTDLTVTALKFSRPAGGLATSAHVSVATYKAEAVSKLIVFPSHTSNQPPSKKEVPSMVF
jgi:hypothetical protein